MRKSAERIAEMLKSRRAACDLSVQEVVDKLKSQYGIELNTKTIYGYENGVAMPKIDVFIALCAIYGVTDIPTETVSASEPPESEIGAVRAADATLSPEDEALLYAYHRASPEDRAIIDNIIARYIPSEAKGKNAG